MSKTFRQLHMMKGIMLYMLLLIPMRQTHTGFKVLLSDFVATYQEAQKQCNIHNMRLLEINQPHNLKMLAQYLQKAGQYAFYAYVDGNSIKNNPKMIPILTRNFSKEPYDAIKPKKHPSICWAAWKIRTSQIPVLRAISCSRKLHFICSNISEKASGAKQIVKREVTFSYLYVHQKFMDKVKEMIFGRDLCKSNTNELHHSQLTNLESRVVGGTAAVYGSQPWQVEIAIYENGRYNHHCSGVIISPFFIITAAHCFKDSHKQLHLFKVIAGDHRINTKDEYEDDYDIEKLVVHPHHNKESLYGNDIAIVKIKAKQNHGIIYSSYVRPACIPNHRTPHVADTNCIVSGWGRTEDTSKANNSKVLQSAEVKLLSTTLCRELYRDYIPVDDGMLCAGKWEGGIDSCRGDSGGPLVCNVSNHLVLFGLVSWGEGCGQPNRPGVYVHVQHYIDWIDETVKQLS